MADSPMVNGDGDLQLSVYCDGSLIPATMMVVSVHISKAINRIPFGRITILDGDMPNNKFPVSDSETFKPGQTIRVEAGWGSGTNPLFEGIVVKHAIRIDANNYACLEVECRDKAVSMSIGRKNANFVEKTDSAIISSLIAGYSSLTSDVEATNTTYKELVQYYATDWDYMLARAELNGKVIIVDAAKVSVKAPKLDASPVLKVTYGLDLMEFQAELDARTQLQSVETVAWDPAAQATIQQQAEPLSGHAQGDIAANALAQVVGLSSYRMQSDVMLDSSSLKTWADGRQLKSTLARVRGNMKFQGNALAVPGSLIELVGVGSRFSGNAFISSVEHVIKDGRWVTEADFGHDPSWFVESHDIVSPLASGVTSGIQGLHIGVVKKINEDPEAQYKIQVSVPIMQAETDGVWARLASSYASSGFGAFFIPEIGDEVILGFLNSDPSHPLILGSLYSSKRKPAYEIGAENFIKAIVTRTKMKIEFDEEKKIITILTPANNKIVISDDSKSILLKDQNNNSVELKPEGIFLDSPKDICLSAKGKVTIDAINNIEITAKADIKSQALNINSNANIAYVAKGSASAELSASGQTTVKGALVMIN